MQLTDLKAGDIIAFTLHGDQTRVGWVVAKATDSRAICMPLMDVEITLDLTDQPKLINLIDSNTTDILVLGNISAPSTYIPEYFPEYLL